MDSWQLGFSNFTLIILAIIIFLNFTGAITIMEGLVLTVNSDLNEDNPQFTLTCISTGGPATTITWTRDSTTVTEGTHTVLNDPETAQYTHNLTVTGRVWGLYTCTVSNNKPSSDSASIIVTGIPRTSLIIQCHFILTPPIPCQVLD